MAAIAFYPTIPIREAQLNYSRLFSLIDSSSAALYDYVNVSYELNPETLEERIICFTATQLGVNKKKVSPDTRLAQDLGMDGDDAVEFFEEFAKTFAVDLRELHTNWGRHFLPEGVGAPPLGATIVICGSILAGFFLKQFVGVLPAWAWGILLIAIAIAVYQKWFADEDTSEPLTVSDLIQAVRAGRWTKPYPDDSWRYWR